MSSPRILYNFASRSRPKKFFDTLDNITNLARHDRYLILCKFDIDDISMNTRDTHDKLETYQRILTSLGRSSSKICAINRDIELVKNWDILVNVSDDIVFTKPGFDLDIIEAFNGDYNLAVHFPDGYVGEAQITMAMIGKELYDRFGYVYHPDYKSLWCDNEMLAVYKQLGVYGYIDKHIFKHEHPANTAAAENDDQYRFTESFYAEDYTTFERRRILNFGL